MKSSRKPLDLLWQFLVSLKLTRLILLILIGFCAAGVLIAGKNPQTHEMSFALGGHAISSPVFRSVGFIFMLSLLAVNLSCYLVENTYRLWEPHRLELYRYLFHASFGVILFGIWMSAIFGFEIRVDLADGAQSRGGQWLKGDHRGWPSFRDHGRAVPGWVDLGVNLAASDFQIRERSSLLSLSGPGGESQQLRVKMGEPFRHAGLRFHLSDYHETGRYLADVQVMDEKTGHSETVRGLQTGSSRETPDYTVKLVEIQEGGEGISPAVELEYQGEKFWIFSEFPDSDRVRRRNNRFHFSLTSVAPVYMTRWTVARDPGAPIVGIGAVLFALCNILSVFRSFRRAAA